jgi:hypothetical protein
MTFLLNYVNLGYGTRVQAENFGVKCCPTLCSLRGEFFVFEVPRTPMGLRHISSERLCEFFKPVQAGRSLRSEAMMNATKTLTGSTGISEPTQPHGRFCDIYPLQRD